MPSLTETQAKIVHTLDIAVDAVLQKMSQETEISLKDYKEMLALLIKAAEQISKYKPPQKEQKTLRLSPTDQLLLQRYVDRQDATEHSLS